MKLQIKKIGLLIISIIISSYFSAAFAGGGLSGANNNESNTNNNANMTENANQQKAGAGAINAIKGQMTAAEVRAKVGKNANTVDGFMLKFENKFEGKTQAQLKEKYQLLAGNIDSTLEKIEQSNMSEAKKQAYRDVFEYIRVTLEEKIAAITE